MNICIIACHSSNDLKIEYLRRNILFFKCVKKIVIINSVEFNWSNDNSPLKDCYGFIFETSSIWNIYKEKYSDLLNMDENELKNHYYGNGIREGRYINNINETFIEIVNTINDDKLCYSKFYHYLANNNVNHFDNIIMTNDSYFLLRDIPDFFNLFDENIEMSTILVSYEIKEHATDFLRRYNKIGIKKWIEYYEKFMNKKLSINELILAIEVNGCKIFNSYNTVFSSSETNSNVNLDNLLFEIYTSLHNYPIVKLKKILRSNYSLLKLPYDFNIDDYLLLNPDLKDIPYNKLSNHFINNGYKEGRIYKSNQQIVNSEYESEILLCCQAFIPIIINSVEIFNFLTLNYPNIINFYQFLFLMKVNDDNYIDLKSNKHFKINLEIIEKSIFIEYSSNIEKNINDIENLKIIMTNNKFDISNIIIYNNVKFYFPTITESKFKYKKYIINNYDNFNFEDYKKRYADLKSLFTKKEDLWNHFIKHGIHEKRFFISHSEIENGDFTNYIEMYNDLKSSGILTEKQGMKHWINYGIHEGRILNRKKIRNIYVGNDKMFYDKFRKEYGIDIRDDKTKFRFICYKYLNYIRRIELPTIKLNQEKEAVLVEFRKFPHLEFTIRNTILKLGNEWSHTIVCGLLNYELIKLICDNISPNIKIIKYDIENVNLSEYSLLFSDKAFWNNFYGEKIIIYQDDTCIFKTNVNDFLDFDYIGAPWPNEQNDNELKVGNGGFSLRNKFRILEVIDKINIQDLQYNSSTIDSMNVLNLTVPPEDVYFSKAMIDYNIGIVSDYISASNFSTEAVINRDSFAGHNFWINDIQWKSRIFKNVIKIFSNSFYDKSNKLMNSYMKYLSSENFLNSNSDLSIISLDDLLYLKENNIIINNNWFLFFDLSSNNTINNINTILTDKLIIKLLKYCKCVIFFSDKSFLSYSNHFKRIPIYRFNNNFYLSEINHNKFSHKNLLIISNLYNIRSISKINNYNYFKNKNLYTSNKFLFKLVDEVVNIRNYLRLDDYTFCESFDSVEFNSVVYLDIKNNFYLKILNLLIELKIPVIIQESEEIVNILGKDYPLFLNNNLYLSDDIINQTVEYLTNLKNEKHFHELIKIINIYS